MDIKKLSKNPYVTGGLAVLLVVAVGFIVYLMWPKDEKFEGQNPQTPKTPPQNPQNISTPVHVKPTLVMFKMEGCGHCTNAMPAFIQAAENLSNSGEFEAIILDATKNAQECKDAQVTGFPTFRLYPEGFPNANFIPYVGNRSTESLLRFVHSEGKDM